MKKNYFISHNDCLTTLKNMPDNSIDSIVTDPPYGLSAAKNSGKTSKGGFMGKLWDYDVPGIDVWKECLRVLKPGGHMLVACGTRTQHRMVAPIEDAGFEIRDVITWLYGSGFPKSTNISKQLDKEAGAIREVIGVNPSSRPNSKVKGNRGFDSGLGEGEMAGEQVVTAPATDAAKQWDGWHTALKPATEHWTLARKNGVQITVFKEVTEELCKLILSVSHVTENSSSICQELNEELNTVLCFAGNSTSTLEDLSGLMATLQSKLTENSFLNIVSLWKFILDGSLQGMNTFTTSTALNLTTDLKILKFYLSPTMQKNTHDQEQNGQSFNVSFVEALLASVIIKLKVIANTVVQCDVRQDMVSLQDKLRENLDSEFFTLCRKPLSESTIAKNVLKHGTGGINVDGCRIGYHSEADKKSAIPGDAKGASSIFGSEADGNVPWIQPAGRFPANLILDEEAAAALDEQSGVLTSGKPGVKRDAVNHGSAYGKESRAVGAQMGGFGDSGGASRFFYCAKASKSDRGDGNLHPTVKNTKLMAYLCKLITPPGGIVLDPFCGSGSTGVGALREGFRFIGIEREAEYVEIIKKRLEHVLLSLKDAPQVSEKVKESAVSQEDREVFVEVKELINAVQ